MFSLIITIVAIALVVALVAATMYHGGDTLTQGRTTADAAAFVTGAQQVGGAAVMYLSLESTPAGSVDALIPNYLASAPVVKGTALALGTDGSGHNIVSSTVSTKDVCVAINKSAGLATPDTVAAVDIANFPYGCLTADNTFQFKF
jgi:hypothetical protein